MQGKPTDAVDFKRLQQLQDSVAGIYGITCLIADAAMQPLTRISKPNAFCTLIQSTSTEPHPCPCSPPEAAALTGGQTVFASCPHSGLENIYIPFIRNGAYLGCWVFLQVKRAGQEVSGAQLAATAMQLDIAAEVLAGAVEGLPTHSPFALNRLVADVEALIQLMMDRGQEMLLGRVERSVQTVAKCKMSSETGILLSDVANGQILLANEHFLDWHNLDERDVENRFVSEILLDFDGGYQSCTPGQMLDAEGCPCEPAQWNDYSPKHGAWLRCTNQLVYWLDGRLAHLVTFRDITSEQRMRDELSRLAYYDRQMNLPNSQKLSADLEHVWHHVKAQEDFLICFDITALRRLNDAHGRKAGDAFLRTVIKWIDHQNYSGLTIYRIGGDEFCVRLTGATAEKAATVAERIYNRFSDLWSLVINGQQVSVLTGVSLSVIGLSSLQDNDELLSVVQRTLDISRKENKIVIYDENTDRELQSHTQVQLSLKKCIKQGMNGFAVHYQPIVDPSTGLWKGLEALCRWNSPEVGVVSPIVFIREAEQLGLIGPIGEWVLEESVRQSKAWGLDQVEGFFISVNLSPVQIMSTGLINSIMDILRRHDWPGSCLCLEVTESTRLNFNNHTLSVIENLCKQGISIALDDFGTGYSSFNNMKNLPVSFVKTDHTFIRGIEQDSYIQYFYNIITELAHKTGMKLVVEGVETREQLEIMLKNGVDYIQGYYFGRPMPAPEIQTHLEKFVEATPPFADVPPTAGAELQSTQGHLIGTATFNVQTRCMQILMGENNFDKAISEVVEIMGAHFGVSRAYLFRRRENGLFDNTHEWCAKGVRPQKQALQKVDIAQVSPNWLPMLEQNGAIVATNVAHLPKDIALPMERQDIRAMAVVPTVQDGGVTGFLGFDDCNGHRTWQTEEIIMLKNLAMMIGGRLGRSVRTPQGEQSDMLAGALESLPLPAFVSDFARGEILWANKSLRVLAGKDVVGQKCYTALGDCDGRCTACRAKVLEQRPEETLARKFTAGDGRVLGVYNCLVPWGAQQHAHLEFTVDLTGLAEPPLQDPLTGFTKALQEETTKKPERE